MRSFAMYANTLLAVAGGAGVVVATIGVLLVLSGALQPEASAPFNWFSQHLDSVDALGGGGERLAWVLAVAAGIFGVLFALLNLRLLVAGSASTPLTLVDDEQGLITMERSSAEAYLGFAARTVPSVEQAVVHAQPSGEGIIGVQAHITLKPGIEVAVNPVATAVRQAMIEAANDGIGLEIENLDLQTAIRRRTARRRRVRRLR